MMTITESHDPVRVTAGPGATAAALSRFRLGDRPLVLCDAAIDLAAIDLEDVLLPEGAIEHRIDVRSAAAASLSEIISVGSRATSVVAIGGGSTLDAAKIARLLIVTPRLAVPLRALSTRSGFVRLPETVAGGRRDLPLLAVPTTIGTGSEVSSVACLETRWGRRLLFSPGLRPDHAVLDPVLTSTLPRALQMEGLFEVILRVLGPAIGSRDDLAADHDSRAIVSGATALAEQLRIGFLGPEERLFAAQLSAASHRTWALISRDSYAAKHWYLANELAWVTGTRKIPATVALLPALWGRIAEGDRRWGSRDRLALAWSWVRAVIPALPVDIRAGLPALFRRWGLLPIDTPAAALRDAASARVRASWGGSLPALGRLDPGAVDQIFAESFPTLGDAISRHGEGVLQK